jgi:hypothetical protein
MKKIQLITMLFAFSVASHALHADVYWNNNNGYAPGGDRDWSNPYNWLGGAPSYDVTAIVQPWNIPANFPIVSTSGNYANSIYLAANSALQIASQGVLNANSLVTGQWGNSGVVDVAGGRLNLGGLYLGNGGYDGKLNISAGIVAAEYLSINTSGGALVNIGSTGSFMLAVSNLNNINYWVSNNAIQAEGGASGWSVNVDSTTQSGKVILTAVSASASSIPEPSTLGTLSLGLILLGGARIIRRRSEII